MDTAINRWPSPVWVHIIQSLEELSKTKMWKKVEFAAWLSWDMGHFLPFVLLVLEPSDLNWNLHQWLTGLWTTPPASWVPSLQTADCGTSQPPHLCVGSVLLEIFNTATFKSSSAWHWNLLSFIIRFEIFLILNESFFIETWTILCYKTLGLIMRTLRGGPLLYYCHMEMEVQLPLNLLSAKGDSVAGAWAWAFGSLCDLHQHCSGDGLITLVSGETLTLH